MSQKQLWLDAPDGQIAATIKPLIQKWDEPATALQILEVRERCAYSGGASTFAMLALSIELSDALLREGKTRNELEKFATWRAEWEE